MRRTRFSLLVLASLLAATGMALLAASPAGAEVNGGCSASMKGVNLAHTPPHGGPAVTVSKDEVVSFSMSGTGSKRFTRLHIYLTFAGWDVDIYDAPAGGGTWSHDVAIHKFAKFGVGYYRLKGVGDFADGSSCDGVALIKVTGDPIGTVAGDVGIGATVAGVFGMLGAGIGAGGGGGGDGGGPGGPTQNDVVKKKDGDEDGDGLSKEVKGWCMLFTIAVLLLPLLLLLFGTSALMMAVVAPVVRVRRKTWPLFRGAFSGLLTGLGVGVLLQEYAIVYPTRTWGIIYIAGGIAFGLAVPWLRRTLSR